MRVLIINTSERMGGAAIAANRLMDALRNNGIQAKMLVRDKQTDSMTVIGLRKSLWRIWQFIWERVVIWKANRFKEHNLFEVDIANTGTDITSLPEFTTGRCHPPALDKPRYALVDRHPPHHRFGQTDCMDYARYVALYRNLPLCRNLREIHFALRTLPHPLQRRKERPLLPDFPEKGKDTERQPNPFCDLQPMVGKNGTTKPFAQEPFSHQHPQCHQYEPVQPQGQIGHPRKASSARRQEALALRFRKDDGQAQRH